MKRLLFTVAVGMLALAGPGTATATIPILGDSLVGTESLPLAGGVQAVVGGDALGALASSAKALQLPASANASASATVGTSGPA